MKIDIFRVKKMSIENIEELFTEEFIATIDMPIIPRVGEDILLYLSEDKGRSYNGVPTIKALNFTVQKVKYAVSDAVSKSMGFPSVNSSVALYVS